MSSVADIESYIYFSAVMSYSLLLLSAFSLLSAPALIMVWILRRKSIWLRGAVGALCVVVMSIVVPVTLLVVSDEPSAMNFQSPAKQDRP